MRSAGVWGSKGRALNEAAAKEQGARLTTAPVDAKTITWAQWGPRWQAAREVAASTARGTTRDVYGSTSGPGTAPR